GVARGAGESIAPLDRRRAPLVLRRATATRGRPGDNQARQRPSVYSSARRLRSTAISRALPIVDSARSGLARGPRIAGSCRCNLARDRPARDSRAVSSISPPRALGDDGVSDEVGPKGGPKPETSIGPPVYNPRDERGLEQTRCAWRG